MKHRLCRERPSAPKTYLYVSDAKVQMLLDGVDRPLRDRVEAKAKAHVPGVPGFEAEVAFRQRQLGRYARAERVCADLAAAGRIGSVFDEKTEYFRGQLLAAWGFWNRYQEGYADVVFFHGFVDENTFVGLGGSAYHTMERADDRLQQYSNSGIQTLMAFLKEQSEAAGRQRSAERYGPECLWAVESWEADHDSSTVPELVEFVAERLLDDADDPEYGIRSIIGSPIYVARSGQPTTRRTLREYEALRNRHAVEFQKKPRLKCRNGRREVGKPSWPKPAPLVDPNLSTEREDT